MLYKHRRLKSDAYEAAEYIHAPSAKIGIWGEKKLGNPLNWRVVLPKGLKDKNVALIHSMESNKDIAELWVMLVALRRAGVASLSLLNTYEGYARQDKVFKAGEAISALTMLKIINALVDNHMVLNIHYGKHSGQTKLQGYDYDLYNLNAFIPVAERLVDAVAMLVGQDALAAEFSEHPLLLVSPDDGAFIYVQEAAALLPRYIKAKYRIDTRVDCGYMDKTRISGTEVRIAGQILGKDGKPIAETKIGQRWAFVLDDETSWGTTLFAATYALVRKIGSSWSRVLTGVVHGKFSRGLEPFKTGLSAREIMRVMREGQRIEPKGKYINATKELMPPRLVVATKSVALRGQKLPRNQQVSIGPIVSHAVKRLIGAPKGNCAGSPIISLPANHSYSFFITPKSKALSQVSSPVNKRDDKRSNQALPLFDAAQQKIDFPTREAVLINAYRLYAGKNSSRLPAPETMILWAQEFCQLVKIRGPPQIEVILEGVLPKAKKYLGALLLDKLPNFYRLPFSNKVKIIQQIISEFSLSQQDQGLLFIIGLFNDIVWNENVSHPARLYLVQLIAEGKIGELVNVLGNVEFNYAGDDAFTKLSLQELSQGDMARRRSGETYLKITYPRPETDELLYQRLSGRYNVTQAYFRDNIGSKWSWWIYHRTQQLNVLHSRIMKQQKQVYQLTFTDSSGAQARSIILSGDFSTKTVDGTGVGWVKFNGFQIEEPIVFSSPLEESKQNKSLFNNGLPVRFKPSDTASSPIEKQAASINANRVVYSRNNLGALFIVNVHDWAAKLNGRVTVDWYVMRENIEQVMHCSGIG